jgi:hypothetical protein
MNGSTERLHERVRVLRARVAIQRWDRQRGRHFESIDDHFYKFDAPDVLEQNPETESAGHDQPLASAFTLARPILLAMIAAPLIPERWQEAIGTLVSALDDAVADANESAGGWEGDLPVC